MISNEASPGLPSPACAQGKVAHRDTDVSVDQKSTSAGRVVIEETPVRNSMYRDQVLSQTRTLVRAFCIRFKIPYLESYTQGIVDSALRGELKNTLKYALAQPMAELTKYSVYEPVPRPSCVPESSTLFIVDLLGLEGYPRRKVLNRLMETKKEETGPTRRALKLCFEVLQLKGLAPKVLLPDLISAVNDHREALTSTDDRRPSKQCQETYERIVDHLLPLPVAFTRLPNAKYTDRAALLELGTEDLHKGSKRLRSGKGLKAELNDFETNGRTGVSSLPAFALQTSELLSMEDSPVSQSQSSKSRNTRQKTRPSNDFERRRNVVPRGEEEDEYTAELIRNARTEENEAHIVALLEPLKVRTISIDSGILRAMASRIQKWVHGELRKSPVFALTGGVPVEDAVKQFSLHTLLGFVSGDYKGATDSIYGSHTNFVIDQIFKRISFPPHLSRHVAAMKRDVTGVILNYSKTLRSEGIPFLVEFEKRFWKAHGKEELAFLEDYVVNDKTSTFSQLLERLEGFIIRKQPKFLEDFRKEITSDFRLNFDEGETFRQSRGQLMGNILSFPVLCIINFATYLNSSLDFVTANIENRFTEPEDLQMLENCRKFVKVKVTVDGETFTFKPELRFAAEGEGRERRAFTNVPVVINGDDILFQGSNQFYTLWSGKIGEVGFVKSVGKNYFSRYFCTINSQLLIPTIAPEVEGFKLSPWVTLDRISTIWWSGLGPDFLRKRSDLQALMGSSYKEQLVDVRSFLSIVQGVFLDSTYKTQRDDFNRLFLEVLDTEIKSFDSENFLVSRTLPTELGGLGLEFPKDNPENLTYSQRVLAGRLNLQDNPFGLAERSVLQEAMGQIIADVEKSKTVRRFPVDEMILETYEDTDVRQYYNKDEFEKNPNVRYRKANELVLREIANLMPTWRTPPPDNIVFKREDLSKFTERVFRWSMVCRKELRDKFANEVRSHIKTALYVKT